MANNSTVLIPKCLDGSVIQWMDEICKDLGVGQLHLEVVGLPHQFDLPVDQPDHVVRRTLIDQNAELVQRAQFSHGQFSAAYLRGASEDEKAKKPFVDAIRFGYSDQPADPALQKERLELCAKLVKRFGGQLLQIGDKAPSDDGGQVSDIVAAHASTLARLESLSAELVERNVDRREELEKTFGDRRASLDNELKAQREADAAVLTIERDKLASERAALDARNQEIDDRHNTIVRRQIRDRMLDDVKSRVDSFGVSQQTEAKRKPVYWGLMSIIGALGAVLIFTIYEITDERVVLAKEAVSTSSVVSTIPGAKPVDKTSASPTQDRSALYWLWARLSVASLSLLGVGFYYVRWRASWAEQHATAELELRQFQIDINRANWVLESCLEWQKETKSNVPPELLTSLSKGLFRTQAKEPSRALHPADELASALLGTASKLKLKAGESEIEFNKPGKIPSAVHSRADP